MLGFFPWEKWLPPYIFGPVMVVGSIALLMFSPHLSWWWWIVIPCWGLYCGWGTWVWFRHSRNVFDPSARSK